MSILANGDDLCSDVTLLIFSQARREKETGNLAALGLTSG